MAEATLDIEAVSFDLDDTLCRYERQPAELLSLAFDEVGIDPLFDVEDYVAAFDALASDAPDMATLRRRAFEHLAVEAGADIEVGRAIAAAYTEARKPGAVTWRRGMQQAYEALAERYPIVVVTNGLPAAQRAKLERLGILDDLATVVYGHEVRKPDPEPFEQALSAVDVSPTAAVHIGDSIEHDIAGATALGMHTVWYPAASADPRPTTDPTPDHRIDSGLELLAYLDDH